MHTFQELRDWVLGQAKVNSHFKLIRLSDEHRKFWDDINDIEYRRGYVPGEYEKPGTPALCDMRLLTEDELAEWKKRFKSFHR